MELYIQIIENPTFWKWYFLLSGALSLISALPNFHRFLTEFDGNNCGAFCYALRCTMYELVVIFVGYIMIFLDLVIISVLLKNRDWTNIVAGVVTLVMPIYGILCISGRGIETRNRLLIDPGIKVFKFGFLGIHMEFCDNYEQSEKDIKGE